MAIVEDAMDDLLLEAVQNRDVDRVRVLLAEGADPNVRDINGRTPLGHAAAHGDVDLVTLLLDAGADVHSGARFATPYEIARTRGHLCIAELLEARGVDTKRSLQAVASKARNRRFSLRFSGKEPEDVDQVPKSWLKEQIDDYESEEDRTGGLAFLISRMEPGDELWWYESPRELWQHKMGANGYCLVRNHRVVDQVAVIQN